MEQSSTGKYFPLNLLGVHTLPETFTPQSEPAGYRSLGVGEQLILSKDRFAAGDIRDWLKNLPESALTLTINQVEAIQESGNLKGYSLTGHL